MLAQANNALDAHWVGHERCFSPMHVLRPGERNKGPDMRQRDLDAAKMKMLDDNGELFDEPALMLDEPITTRMTFLNTTIEADAPRMLRSESQG